MIDFLFSWIFDLLLYWLLFFMLTLGLLSRRVTKISPVSLPPMTSPVKPDRKDDKS
jgi:biopolymer transport protein ExbD